MLSSPPRPTSAPVRFSLSAVAAAALLLAFSPGPVSAQAPAAPVTAAAPLQAEQLEQLVAPIALYPDDLIAIILPASTNPLQIVQADRFLEQRKSNPKLELNPSWDDPVKTLCNYPDVVKKMSQELDWTTQLGEAVVADTGEVLEAVQAFRRRAQAAGNLKSDDKQKVVVEQTVITIAPANPEVVYIPQYNPQTVVVAGAYPTYPYYPAPYPAYWYPYAPGAALAAGVIWGAAIGAAWSGGHYGSHYGGGNNTINIDRGDRNTTINQGGNRTNVASGNRGSGNQSTQWKSDKKPGQVSNSTGANRGARAGDTRTSGAGAGNVGGGAGGGAGGGGRAGTQPAGGGVGGGSVGGGSVGGGAGGGAGGGRAGTQPAGGAGGGAGGARPSTQPAGGGGGFDGMGSSRQTQMDSSRGASSRSAAGSPSSAGRSPSASPSSASRSAPASRPSGGGGGGGARGGGGGGRGGGGRR